MLVQVCKIRVIFLGSVYNYEDAIRSVSQSVWNPNDDSDDADFFVENRAQHHKPNVFRYNLNQLPM